MLKCAYIRNIKDNIRERNDRWALYRFMPDLANSQFQTFAYKRKMVCKLFKNNKKLLRFNSLENLLLTYEIYSDESARLTKTSFNTCQRYFRKNNATLSALFW